jgi:hypothetical protein
MHPTTLGLVRRYEIVYFFEGFFVATHLTTLGLVRRYEIVSFLRDSLWRRTLRLLVWCVAMRLSLF